jgi:hypothetical protein
MLLRSAAAGSVYGGGGDDDGLEAPEDSQAGFACAGSCRQCIALRRLKSVGGVDLQI